MVIIASYIFVKFLIRPFVLEREYSGIIEIFVLSYPNFCEAIVGTIFLTFALLIINGRVVGNKFLMEEKFIPFIAVLIAATYVLLQEFKIHNLGGVNVYDPYDVLFSIFGLVTGYIIINRIKPRMIIK